MTQKEAETSEEPKFILTSSPARALVNSNAFQNVASSASSMPFDGESLKNGSLPITYFFSGLGPLARNFEDVREWCALVDSPSLINV